MGATRLFTITRNDGRSFRRARVRGIALLVMLSLVLVAFTAIAISRLSTNSIQQKRATTTQAALTRARDAIMGFALSSLSGTKPPGTLPCPDTDGDGFANASPTGVCTSVRGLVPVRDLGLEQSVDASGAPLWYVVAPNYAGSVPPGVLRNSSLTSTLTVFSNAIGANQTMAFIVISPGQALTGQTPSLLPLAAVTQFLEGENANASLNTYNDLKDATHNDVILGMGVGTFWSSVEKLVLSSVSPTFQSYRTACGFYPWAVPFAALNDNSVLNTYEGRAPIGTALPCNWGVGLTAGVTLPPWFTTHWTKTLYYAICKQAVPANPPTAPCLQLIGASGTTTARAVLMAPGAALMGQTRGPGAVITNFFEGTDNTVGDNTFNNIKSAAHTATQNDLIHTIP